MRFHHRAVVIGMVVGGLSLLAYVFVRQGWMVFAIIGPVATTQALAFGAEHGEPGGGFLPAACLVFSALLITLFGVVPRLRPAPEPVLASE